MNKATRLKGYEYALMKLHEEEGENWPYICLYLKEYCINKLNMTFISYSETIKLFPEFLKCKPEFCERLSSWWDKNDEGILMRVTALEWCIEQLTSK